MALTQRFAGVAQGAMVLTGNTITTRLNIPFPPAIGVQIFQAGTYITTQNLQVPSYPAGTTLNYLENSSMAILNVVPNSKVLFAHLMWTFRIPQVSPDSPVTFTTPVGTYQITPTFSDISVGLFWRAADVKTLVQAGIDLQPLNAQYTVGAVPGFTPPTGIAVSVAWGLIVIYENEMLPFRYFNVNTGAEVVTAAQQLTFNFTNFATPSQGPIKGYLLMNYTDGDIVDGAQLRVGAAAPGTQIGNASYPWDNLSPYSRINNMFPAIILNADTEDPNIGLLDTRGSFGNLNLDPYGNGGTGSAPAAARNNYDLAGYDISAQLVNGQTNLYTNITFGGMGGATSVSQSVQLDINSANIGGTTKSVDKDISYVGDIILYTVDIDNRLGAIDAQNVILTDIIPSGLQFLMGSVEIDGVPSPSDDPNTGISIGTIAAGANVTVTFKATVDFVPATNPAKNSALVAYSFESIQGQPLIDATFTTNDVSTLILPPLEIDVRLDLAAAPDVIGVGEIINYTSTLCNLSTRTITNTLFLCPLPQGTEFIEDSFTIDGVPQPGENPFVGVVLGDYLPTQCVTLGFQVKYVDPTCCQKIGCYSTANFNYQDNPNTPVENKTIKSNIVYTNKYPDVMII